MSLAARGLAVGLLIASPLPIVLLPLPILAHAPRVRVKSPIIISFFIVFFQLDSMTSLEPSPKSVVASLFEPYGLPLLAQDDNNTAQEKNRQICLIVLVFILFEAFC